MSDGRRLRLREQSAVKGPVRAHRKARSRLGSVSCSNEESTEGEEDTVGCAKKISGGDRALGDNPKDNNRGLPVVNGKSNGVSTSLAEEDVIDGFLILSFMTYQDLETSIKGSVDNLTFPQVPDTLPEAVAPNSQTEEDQKEDEDDIRNNTEQYGKLEPMLTKGNHIFEGLGGHEKEESVSENNNEPTTPNQNFMTESPKYEPSPAVSDVIPPNKPSESENKLNICDTVEEEKKVPPDLPPPRPESPKQDAAQVRSKPSSPFPLKSPHFLPLQNGPLQQPEPSAAVAAVTVTTSTANPATVPTSSQLGSSNPAPLPSSTSPAGGVPFPSSLLSQEEFPVSPTAASSASKTVSPVLRSKSYDSVVKPRRGSNSDVVHSVPYPICSSYSDYTVNYSTNQYPTNKHSYLNQDNRDTNQRVHHQKFVANNYYHHHQQPSLEKYPKETVPRATSKEVISCDGYKNDNYIENRFESKPGNDDVNYCVSQAYTDEKPCDPQSVYKKTNPNNVYNFKSNELLTQNSNESNVVKNSGDKSTNKLVSDCYPNVTKAKVPNRTTYYQSIVNKTHSRHKTNRRVLPASAYENNSKPVINNYPIAKPAELLHGHGNKPVQYSSSHYNTEGKKTDYYQPVSLATTSTSNSYNCSPYKLDAHQSNINNNSTCSSNWTESQSVGSRSFKVNTEQCVNSYRDKSGVSNTVNTNSKAYNVHQGGRSFHDGHSKIPSDSSSDYGNNDYYQKGSVTYSRSGTTQSAIGDNFKSANHTTELAAYQNRNQAYSHSRTSNEKNRSFYQNQENNFKQYQQELVPKQNIETSHNYKIQSDVNAYSHYGSSSSLKTKETVPQNLESSKPVPIEHISTNSLEVNSNIQPSVSEVTTYYPSSSARDKATFYPYAEPSHFQHRRTPPIPVQASKPQTTFEPLNLPPKDTESFRISSSSAAISSYSQRTTVSSPVTVFDNSRSTVKTIWSPSITTASISGTTNREVIAASSRDSHSSHSNSSISSLSQLSQSLGSGPQGTSVQSSKEFPREGRSSSNGHSRSSSRNETPVCSTVPITTSNSATVSSTSASYGVSGSLTSLIFSKPSWTSPSVTTVLTNPGSHFTPPVSGSLGSPVPSVLPLAPSLPSNHHSSPFSHHPSAAALHSAGHHVMFAPPLPPAGPLSSPSLPLATAAGPSPFGGDSLFAPPSSQDLLRRDLDARFLASQDRSINVPPPPYLRAEMHQHQHQHTHMHQHSPFLPPPIGSSLLPPSAAHLYDKFPKVDSSFYGRNALGLPAYPLSPLLAPGSATATPTPFAPPGHLAAFQPKISSLVKAKTMKSGRWCAMHVRISWEIYHHQQKQQADSQKSGNGTSKAVTDLLRPPNHLFGSMPRPHELGFSSPLLGAAASIHGRSPYDVTPQHPSFLGPTPAHLGMTPFARPNYPGLGIPGNSFGGLGSLASLTGAGMLSGRDLGPGYLGMSQDPWSRLHRTPPNFPSPSAMNPSSWGGLKAEAERDRVQRREDQEREKEKEKQKKTDAEKREKESEKSKEMLRESKREHERQKERDRESRVSHLSNNPDSIRNGEVMERNREREWERTRERRDSSRSPIRSTHKSEGGFDSSSVGHKSDIKVKEEKKEEEHSKESVVTSGTSDRERTKSGEPSHPEPVCDYMPRSMLPGLPMSLSSSEQARLAGSLGAISQVPPPHFWNPLPPPPPQSAASASERYRSLELQHARELDREQLMQKYASLSSVMPLLPERYREAELARHLSSSEAAAREVERQLQADRDRQVYERTKLPPPPLRPNDPPYVPPPGLPPSGGLFSSLSNPFLNSLCGTNYPPRTKPSSPGGIGNGIPPPLIPCVSQSGSPVTTSTTPSPLHLKLGTSSNSNIENSREHYASKERRDLTSHSASEVESQSR